MKHFVKETIISIMLSLILIFVLSIAISKTSLKEDIIIPGIISISSISIIVGSIRISKLKKEKGIINGILIGLLYMGSMYIISSIILKDFSLSTKSLIMIISGMMCGVIGGIIGVNF